MGSALPTSTTMLRVDPSREVQTAEFSRSIGTKTVASDAPLADIDLESVISTALARSGLSHAEACERMSIDPSQWSKQLKNRDNAHVSAQRLLKLPMQFWIEYIALLASKLGLHVSHATLEQQLLFATGDLVQTMTRLVAQRRVA